MHGGMRRSHVHACGHACMHAHACIHAYINVHAMAAHPNPMACTHHAARTAVVHAHANTSTRNAPWLRTRKRTHTPCAHAPPLQCGMHHVGMYPSTPPMRIPHPAPATHRHTHATTTTPHIAPVHMRGNTYKPQHMPHCKHTRHTGTHAHGHPTPPPKAREGG